MDYKRALEIYGIDSTMGMTIADLKRMKRRLCKENHPDNQNKIVRFTIDEISQAYSLLDNILNGGISQSMYAMRQRNGEIKKSKELTIDELLGYLNDIQTYYALKEKYLIFIKLPDQLKIFDAITNQLIEYEHEHKVMLQDDLSVNINLTYPFEFGYVAELVVNQTKHIGVKLDSARNIVFVDYPLTVTKTLRIMYTIMMEKSDEE